MASRWLGGYIAVIDADAKVAQIAKRQQREAEKVKATRDLTAEETSLLLKVFSLRVCARGGV